MDTEIIDKQDTMSAKDGTPLVQGSEETSPDVQQFYRTATVETAQYGAAKLISHSPKKRETIATQKTVLFAS